MLINTHDLSVRIYQNNRLELNNRRVTVGSVARAYTVSSILIGYADLRQLTPESSFDNRVEFFKHF